MVILYITDRFAERQALQGNDGGSNSRQNLIETF